MLTGRELEILRLVAGGATNQAIADTNILGKLQLSTRAAAISYALRHEILNDWPGDRAGPRYMLHH